MNSLTWMKSENTGRYHIFKGKEPVCGNVTMEDMDPDTEEDLVSLKQKEEEKTCQTCSRAYASKTFQNKRTSARGFMP